MKLRPGVNPPLRCLSIFGYYTPEEESSSLKRVYPIYSVAILTFFFWSFVVSELINIVMVSDDLEKVTEASFLTLTHLSQCVKLLNFCRYSKRIRQLADDLEQRSFRPLNARHNSILTTAVWTALFTFYFFGAMTVITCCGFGVIPYLEKSADGSVSLPLGAYYPFAVDYSPVFEIVFFYQMVATIVNAVTDICMDTLASGFMAIYCGELDVLNDKLEHVREFSLDRVRAKDPAFQFDEDSLADIPPKLQSQMNAFLAECVQQHLDILSALDEFGTVFNLGVFAQFIVGTMIVCVTMFNLTLIDLYSVKFISLILYQGCMMFEIALYCWFGNEIILKSSNISDTIYNSDWLRASNAYKKSVLLVMTRSQIPMRVYAGNLFTLSLVTFGAIMRSSWSYFAVLRRVHDDQ